MSEDSITSLYKGVFGSTNGQKVLADMKDVASFDEPFLNSDGSLPDDRELAGRAMLHDFLTAIDNKLNYQEDNHAEPTENII